MIKDIDKQYEVYHAASTFGKVVWFLKQDNVWGTDLRFTVWRRLYFFVMYLISNSEISRLLNVLAEDKELFTIVNRFPCILELGYRSWLYYKATTTDRVDVISNHFSTMLNFCNKKLIHALYSEEGLILWQDEETGVYLRMYYGRSHRKEGLLACELCDKDGKLYMSDIWLNKDSKGVMSAYIGSLQGRKGSNDIFTVYTKKYFGLRTKVMLLDALRFALTFFEVEKIYAVSDIGACVNHKMSAKRRIQFSLNELWTEIGGKPTGDERFYELPLLPEKRPLSEMPTKRRAKHRKQYEFLDGMQAAVTDKLTSIK